MNDLNMIGLEFDISMNLDTVKNLLNLIFLNPIVEKRGNQKSIQEEQKQAVLYYRQLDYYTDLINICIDKLEDTQKSFDTFSNEMFNLKQADEFFNNLNNIPLTETKNNVKKLFSLLSDTGNMTPQEISEYYKDFISKVDERSNKSTIKKTTTTTNSDCPSNKAPLTEQVTSI